MYIWNNQTLSKCSDQTCYPDLLQGKGIFETILVKNHSCFFLWDDHIQRLRRGIEYLGQSLCIDCQRLYQALSDCFFKENRKGFSRLNIFYLPEKGHLLIRIFPFQWPLQPARLYMDNQYFRGNSPHYQLKTISRMENIVFQQLAKSHHCDDFLFIDNYHHILETCLANIFFVRTDGVLETPSATHKPFLNGVLRNYLLNSQQLLDIECKEKTISVHSIAEYSQAFLTNGLRLVQPISSIGNCQYQNHDKGWALLEKILKSI
jgi:branched-subunit amino acid aminotransferase/4-amino-4-deoxychorismate lyase